MMRRDKKLPRGARWLLLPAAVGVLVGMAGCGERKVDATQVAARVNQSDITVHQVNFMLQQDHSVRPDQLDAASKRVLESLIDQELAVQKSIELKLDRDPQVVQALEAARREVLARAYKERVTQGVTRAGSAEARSFYDTTPALFKERRVYSLQELVIDAPAAKQAWVVDRLAKAKTADEFAEALKAEGLRYTGSHAVKPAEQLPMGLVDRFAQMKDGESAVLSDAPNLRVVFVAASRIEPVSFERAAPAIEQYLATLAKRRAIDDNLKALRTAAQISYQGKFVGGPGAAGGPAASAPAAGLPSMVPPPETSPEPVQMTVPDAAPPPASAGSGMDPNIAKKGMGLK
ncbi:MAG TPA: EpsD family peptidyl-prolyl cis-trans isomerase [Ideonella sp.]|uniref:EpsD family peptidyl-prolyl cis-trans isomerase n=1 Tax=Ideonella sp. TaxID=1929293 RepID=UPI002E381E74|nr:EpsD family peptidyl-prolyl cis-trans isomerase [Ideonella sp.]HEX5687218.1 EpsD family peptidyl-prolyl cis-trans isomerase [Ideonella sp.]